MNILPVLLAGGAGTRLWPLSRAQYPKQFLKLLGDRTLLQDTVLRVAGLPGVLAPLVVCSADHRFIAAEQLREIDAVGAALMLEPEGRDTAPAAAVAAHYAAQTHGPDTVVVVIPADQSMTAPDRFHAAMERAAEAARSGRIVTFGIRPTRAETGFGYMQAGKALAAGVFEVSRFVEKPDAETATTLIGQGDHYWNGGMFVFQAATLLAELDRLEPAMGAGAAKALADSSRDMDFIRLAPEAFKACRSVSIDYAIMEKTRLAALVPLDAGWDDVGSWRFMDALAKDADGNVGRGDVVFEAAADNLVHAQSRLVALAGVKDHIVVETKDAVLVTTRDRVQDVKKIVARLAAAGRPEVRLRSRVYRPWGSYETVATGERFQVKHLFVKPGSKLSLQMHFHRAEHWVVVRGTARVTCDEKVFLMREDESTYVPLGARHRLENPGRVPLELIEVQSGAYLGEDDIVRFDDVYGRVGTDA